MARIRVQFPDESPTLLGGSKEIRIDESDARKALDAAERRLKNLSTEGILISRPTLNSARVTRTTGGPAIAIEFTGDVNIDMLREIQRSVERQVRERATETIVITTG